MQFFHGCERIAKWCYSHEQKGKKYIESICDGITGQYHDSGADRSQRMDRLGGQFHTQIWFLIMIVLGVGAAFRNVYYLTKSFYSEDMKKEHERLQYIEALKKQGQARREQTENASGEQKDADKKN